MKDLSKDEAMRGLAFLAKSIRGQSAKAMTLTLLELNLDNLKHHPYDSSDFGRCYNVLQAMPSLKDNFSKLAELSSERKALVENWDYISENWEKGHFRTASEIILQILVA